MMQDRLLNAIYAIEFLIALIAALLVWNYVGGPTHLDYVPWQWKGLLPLGIAASVVRISIAGNLRKAGKWIVLLCILVVACGLLSYYAHINEPQDEGDDIQQTVPTSLKIHFELPRPVGKLHQHGPVVL
jgi:peptidoglycan/LPS O-acetylase OafA/YrhL